MKKLFLLLAMVSMLATACDELGLEDENGDNTEQPGNNGDNNDDNGSDDGGDNNNPGGDDNGDDNGGNENNNPLDLITSITPINIDEAITIETSAEGAFATIQFEVLPKEYVSLLAENWVGHAQVQAKYDGNEGDNYVDMPIVNVEADNDNGVISITISGENLSNEFYLGTQTASARIVVTYEDKELCSEFREIVANKWFAAELPTPGTNEIFYLADDIITPQNTEIVSNNYDYTKGCYKITLNEENPVIGNEAFQIENSSLTSIALGEGITEIGSGAFAGCRNLTSVTIPSSVTTIKGSAFSICTSLTSITIPDNVTEIGSSAFSQCYELQSVSIGNGITKISNLLFSNCNKLTDVSLTDNITEIGENAFNDCSSLTTFTIPNNVTAISAHTFTGCRSLTAINIHDKITSIGQGAFNGCNGLQSVTIGNSVTKIDGYAFAVNNVSLASLTIPESVTEIDSHAFSGMTVDELTINGAVVEAPFTGLFWHTGFTFKKLTIGGNITKIGERAFAGCKVETLEILNGVTAIESNAFLNCRNLTSVTMPSSITIVYAEAFKNCGNVKRVDISDLAAWCKTEFRENPANPLYSGKAKLYLNNEEITELTIPSDVTVIKAHAFTGCSNNLKCVTIPESVTEIGERAFCDCNTDELIINSNLTSNNRGWLDYFNFKKCTIGGNVTNIKEDAFLYCNSVKSVNILNGVSNIGNGAFRGCTNLTDVNIPESVSSMGIMIFNGCSNLKNVYCKPTTPPSLGGLSFDSNASDRKIYVPQESVETYKNADGWSNYADAIVGYDF